MSWDTSSIAAMEQTAREEAEQDCSIKIRGQWLCVTLIEDGKFHYQWGKNLVTRNTAIEIHKTK